ncbi:odorant receptor 67c-like [Vespula pensylvanica]|uniref:odorant receptor 67c-like n=1 Tax=Vespula pensylvanica TaxID=30213 RepID=UPI001CBA103D|nr:odorant receptor 67c-like [Vespula pensylvanica]
MEDFIKRMNIFERTILQRYVDKCAMFHLAMTFSYYTICVAFILGPTILPRPFPTFAEYPFKVESHPIHEIIYFQQAFVGIQAAVGVTIDCQVAFLLWYTGARFEILAIKLINIVNEDELKACIKLHDDLLSYPLSKLLCRYGKNVVKAVRFIILTSIGVSSVCIVFGGVEFLFVGISFRRIIETNYCLFVNALYLTTGRFDNTEITICLVDDRIDLRIVFMLSTSRQSDGNGKSSAVGSAAYRSNWINKSAKMKSSIYFLIQRSQKPVTISVDGIIPPLSLQYYLSFLSASFRYFTTLRAFLIE